MQESEQKSQGQSACNGYRLHKLEAYNWGTFDREVFSVRPNGQTTLLVGQNGSGKSTLVDALLTLLVRPGVRNFNVAAGAKKTERDERSYVKGAYDRSSDDDGNGIQVKFLRPNPSGYSAILASFHNSDTRKTFTIAQLLYVGSDQSVEKIYCFAEDERSIREDFGGLDSPDGLLKTLRQRGWRVTKTFSECEGWFLRTIRAKTKAMEVFNQTVAVKDIQRLNDFIRHHMLEPQPWSEKVDRLLGHFSQLNEAHQSLVRVRQQFEQLQPIVEHGKSYLAQHRELEKNELLLVAADAFFSQKTLDLFAPELEIRRDALDQVRSRKNALANEMSQLQEQCRRIRNEIDQVGGARLREIPILIHAEQAYVDQTRKAYDRFHEALRRAGMRLTVTDEQHFAGVRRQLPIVRAELASSISRCEEERDARILERGEVRRVLAESRHELDGLNQRRENLPEWCVTLRQLLCAQLGLSVKELPFVAELIAVRPEERDWEASIEKVLHGFALSLLVPQRLYHLVSSYVDRTRLADGRGRGQRLVYLRVGELSLKVSGPMPTSDSLLRKLVFREGHSLVPWVKVELQERFDYRCCETIGEFQQSRGLALTRARHAKAGDARHDKDDRDQATNPRNFVLGWDNREKRHRIAADIARLEAEEAAIQEKIQSIENKLTGLRTQFAAIDEAGSFAPFQEIDYERHEREIEALQCEKRAIEEQSDAITLLKQRLSEAEDRERSLLRARDEAVAEERELENRIHEAETLVANAQNDLRRRESDGTLAGQRVSFSDIEVHFAEAPLTVTNLFQAKDTFRASQQDRIIRLRRDIEPAKDHLLEAMSDFMRSFPSEHDLRAHIDYLASFLELRQRIEAEDLPRHEQRFKERLNEKVIHEIGLFRGELERERRSIEEKIDTLNISLRPLEYRPGTHIQLEPRAVRDPEIVEFQTKLRECIEGSFDSSAAGNEARFVRIQELLQRLQDENNRRWREKVTDVRRWFDFVAAVIDRETNKTVSIYEDSSGQSGGEKAKLAFTILVAAIAYQYDLDPEHASRDRFHFVVVDEMFSKVDDQHAEYALELFRQFGLQLLIVAPLDAKARVTQPYVGCYLHVNKRENRSEIFEMTAQEFEEAVQVVHQRHGLRPAIIASSATT